MTMAMYSTEIWLFRNQYEPPQPGSSGSRKSRDRGPSYISRPKIWSPMKEAALFVTAIYTKYRFESPVSTAAPRNDLVHISEKEVIKTITTAFNRHLWYLSELLVGFGLFDAGVTIEE